MSLEFYKILHLFGLILTITGLSGLFFASTISQNFKGSMKIWAFATHGVGLLLLLVSGFGMAARLGLVQGLPGWIHAKLLIWLLLGGAMAVIKRKANIGWPLLVLVIVLAGTSAIFGVMKPF